MPWYLDRHGAPGLTPDVLAEPHLKDLCAAAPPAGSVVSVAVRELCIGKSFRFEDMGPLDLKGFPAPTPAFAVIV
jgi:hypothetical protein